MHGIMHLLSSLCSVAMGGRSRVQVLIAMQVQQLVQQGDAGLARLSQLHQQIAWPSGDDSAMAPAEVCAERIQTYLTVPSSLLYDDMARVVQTFAHVDVPGPPHLNPQPVEGQNEMRRYVQLARLSLVAPAGVQRDVPSAAASPADASLSTLPEIRAASPFVQKCPPLTLSRQLAHPC